MSNDTLDSTRRAPSGLFSHPLPPPIAYIADLPLSLTVYFTKDVIPFLSALFFSHNPHPYTRPSPPRQEKDPLAGAAGLLLRLHLTEHPVLVREVKVGKGEKEKPPSSVPPGAASPAANKTGGGGVIGSGGWGGGGGGGGSGGAVDGVVEEVKNGVLGGPVAVMRVSSNGPVKPVPPVTSTPTTATTPLPLPLPSPSPSPSPAPSSKSIHLIRRHLSKQAPVLLSQRKAEFAAALSFPSPSPSTSVSAPFPASSIPSPLLAENTAQCIALVRVMCALCCLGWQMESVDATNLLLLVSPLSSDDFSYMDDGGDLSRFILCFIATCKPPINKLTPAWAPTLSTIRRFCLAPHPLPSTSALNFLLQLHLTFCRTRTTDRLLPSVLAGALGLSIESQVAGAMALLLDFQDRGAFDELLMRGMGRATSSDLPSYGVYVHWMLVNDAVDASSVYRYAYWLSSMLCEAEADPAELKRGVPSSPLLSSQFFSVMELFALTCVEGKWHGNAVDDRLLSEREVRRALYLPPSASLLPSIISSPASSFATSDGGPVMSSWEWLTSTPLPLSSLLPALLSAVYYIGYYDLLCYNVGHSSTSSLRLHTGYRPSPYPCTLLLSLPLPLLLRVSEVIPMHEAVRPLLSSIIRQRCPFFFLPESFSTSSLPPRTLPDTPSFPLFDAENPSAAVEGLKARQAVLSWHLHHPHRLLTGESRLDAHSMNSAALIEALSFYARVDAVEDMEEARTAFTSLCLQWLALLGPTFAVTLLRGMRGEGEEEMTLPALLHNPLPLLHLNYDLHPSLLPLLFASLTSLLLTSRCYWRCLQATTRRRRDPSTDSPSKHSEKKKKKKRDRISRDVTDDPSPFPLPPPSDAVDGDSHVMGEEEEDRVPPAYIDVEDEAARLLRESERRHKQRFPFDAEEARGEKVHLDYHTRYTSICQEGRQRLLIREDGEDPDDSLCTEVGLLQEWKILRALLDLIAARDDVSNAPLDTADSGKGVWPQGSHTEVWKAVATAIGEEEEAAVMRLLKPRVIAHPAWEHLCTLLCTLVSASPLLLRLLLYRTLPTSLLPSLLMVKPELCGFFLPLVPLLLSSTSLRVQVFGVHLLAALYLTPRVTSQQQNERVHAVNLLIRRISLTLQPPTDSIEEKATRTRYDPHGVLQLAREAVAPLLLLATRAHKHELSLLRVVRAAMGKEEMEGGGMEDGMEQVGAVQREEKGSGAQEQVEVEEDPTTILMQNGVGDHADEKEDEWVGMERRKRVKLREDDEMKEVQETAVSED